MARATIDFGIDLGTTNSAIAVLNGTEVRVFKNNEGAEFTPSVVWIDRNNRLHIGQRAKNQAFKDPQNTASEFKLQMGKTDPILFKRSGRKMTPDELSAEVLKSLKVDGSQPNDPVEVAAITVPADFDLPQNAATTKAARLAGLLQSPLIQEPVAAALSYGFQSLKDNVFWMSYDIGGGTFDAAIIQVRDGQIQVVNHGGDRHLGGKLIDWEIVEQILVPALTK
jgi:molecular chaperone DnaK